MFDQKNTDPPEWKDMFPLGYKTTHSSVYKSIRDNSVKITKPKYLVIGKGLVRKCYSHKPRQD